MNTLEAGKNPRDIILKLIVTKRSSILIDKGKYAFEVDPCTNKTEIKIIIEAVLRVKVGQVATQNRKGKTYRTCTGQNKHKDVRRATVTLREGAIDIFGDQA